MGVKSGNNQQLNTPITQYTPPPQSQGAHIHNFPNKGYSGKLNAMNPPYTSVSSSTTAPNYPSYPSSRNAGATNSGEASWSKNEDSSPTHTHLKHGETLQSSQRPVKHSFSPKMKETPFSAKQDGSNRENPLFETSTPNQLAPNSMYEKNNKKGNNAPPPNPTTGQGSTNTLPFNAMTPPNNPPSHPHSYQQGPPQKQAQNFSAVHPQSNSQRGAPQNPQSSITYRGGGTLANPPNTPSVWNMGNTNTQYGYGSHIGDPQPNYLSSENKGDNYYTAPAGRGPPYSSSNFHKGGRDVGFGGASSSMGRAGKTGWETRNGRFSIREYEDEIFDDGPRMQTGINFDSYDDIPVEVTGMDVEMYPPIESFQSTNGIHELLMRNVTRVNYFRPTPVQRHAIPVTLAGRDLMACAQTGSGKTAAFLFPVISCMLKLGPPPSHQTSRPSYSRREPAVPVCLTLSPTRELTMQIYNEARKFSFGTGIRTCVVYGGNDVRSQIYDLEKGCDICVATPGRLKDLIERGKMSLEYIRHLILDEADRMLDMGFYPQIREIVVENRMPTSRQGRQTVMFSATFPREVQQLAHDFLLNYIFITVGRVGSTNTFIEQRLQYVQEDQKRVHLGKLIRETEQGLILIFVETKRKADQIEVALHQANLDAVSIHGDRTQYEREEALRCFRDGICRIMVATDVAARGLDIPNITHVINFDIPNNIDDYVHRIGRTGRAGNKGLATSFINENNWPVYKDLVNMLEESQQEIPGWFKQLVADYSKSKGGAGNKNNSYYKSNYQRPGGGGSSRKDIRHAQQHMHYTHNSQNKKSNNPTSDSSRSRKNPQQSNEFPFGAHPRQNHPTNPRTQQHPQNRRNN